jgi:photosystem II stability/assembly factor-like uncharacterized protein
MAFDPTVSNRSVIYAGTGELQYSRADGIQGAGVFKSTDFGVTWVQSTDTASWKAVGRLATSGTGSILAAATGGVYLSTDGGQHWARTFTSSDANAERNGLGLVVAFDPHDSTKAVAEVVDYDYNALTWRHKILYSQNGGAQWFFATMPTALTNYYDHIELAYSPSTTGVIFANASSNLGEIWKSTDGGMSFARVTTAGSTGCTQGACALWVSPIDSTFIVTGGYGFPGVCRSTNGGATVASIGGVGYGDTLSGDVHADQHRIIESPAYSSSNRQVYLCTDGGIFRTDDISVATIGSGSWIDLNYTYQTAQYHGAAGNLSGSGLYVGGTQDNGTLLTTSASTTATQVVAFSDGGLSAIDPTDPTYVYAESQYLNLFRSRQGGAPHTAFAIGLNGGPKPLSDAGSPTNSAFVGPFALDPHNPTTMLAGSVSPWRSLNIKADVPDWDRVRPAGNAPIVSLAIARGDPNVIWIAEAGRFGIYPNANGTIAKTSNGSAVSPSWTVVRTQDSVDGLPQRAVTSIFIDPDDSGTVYVTFGGFDGQSLWRTRNSGITWSPAFGSGITALPPAPARTIVRHPRNSNILFVGTDIGLYESDDSGATWSPSQEGPADASVYELRFVYGSEQLLMATHGRGLWTADASGVPSYAPTHLVATASGTSTINVAWDSYAGATSYQLLKSSGGAPFAPISVAGTSYSDTAVAPGATYLYKVKAVLGSLISDSSNVDLATTIVFTSDNSLLGTAILAVHLQEIRAAANMLLVAAGLPQITFGSLIHGVTPIAVSDIADVRAALANAYYSIGLPVATLAPLAAGSTVVSASHFQELRNMVK